MSQSVHILVTILNVKESLCKMKIFFISTNELFNISNQGFPYVPLFVAPCQISGLYLTLKCGGELSKI